MYKIIENSEGRFIVDEIRTKADALKEMRRRAKIAKIYGIQITPTRKVPNAERKFKVNAVLDEGFLYGCSSTCDGYVMPFSWIKDIKIVKGNKESCRA